MDLNDRTLDSAFATFRSAFPGTTCDAAAEAVLRGWLTSLVAWNKKLDLTAARNTVELFDLMLADAFALAPHFPQGATLVDIGTGAGAPGLPIAALRPDLRVTLVEPLAKRTSFLRTALAAVGRTDVTIIRGKGEDLPAAKGLADSHFDVAISRATLAPADWLNMGVSLTHAAGTVWVLTAREAPPPDIEGARPFANASKSTGNGVARDGGPETQGARPFANASKSTGNGVARDGGPETQGALAKTSLDYRWPGSGVDRHATAYARKGANVSAP